MFNQKGIEVIRVGLQNTDEITDPNIEGSEVVAGPYHPAFRQLVESGLWYDSIVAKIKDMYTLDLIVKQDEKVKQGKLELEILEKYPEFLEDYK